MRRPTRVAEAFDAYLKAGKQGSVLSALARPCWPWIALGAARSSILLQRPLQQAKAGQGERCAAGSSWASGVAWAVPQASLCIEDGTTLHRVDVICSPALPWPHLPHGPREAR